MSRLVIDVTGEQHQKIKTLAALNGKSIKDFVLEKVLQSPPVSDDQAWGELKQLLIDRIQTAESGELSEKSMRDIADEMVEAINQ